MQKEGKDGKRLSYSLLLLAATMLTALAASTIGVGGTGASERFVKAALFAIAAGLGVMTMARASLAKEVRLVRLSMMVAVTLFIICAIWFFATTVLAPT